MMTTYTVQDTGLRVDRLGHSDAVQHIRDWYSDVDQWATGHGDEKLRAAVESAVNAVPSPPASGGMAGLERYCEEIRDAVGCAAGLQGVAGHGNYYVSPGDEMGLDLRVTED